ncbi:MAG: GH3 auxin-responsive promoter family protein [Phycisphaerae bacterium]|nr:GH3 auxin-responsive promoter family protein [Phycisphaerae bacterium]
MPHRPTLIDRLMCVAAKAHARQVYRRFCAATRQATAIQERVLLAKIRRNADSQFGRDYGFAHIHSPADFVRQVPILRYEDHAPYIEKLKAGDFSALLGPGQRVHMFALTSGTTATPKYIPVTDAFLKEYRRGWNAFGIKALLDHPHAILRPIAQVSSRMDESRTAGGIPCGAITGLMAATQKRLVRKYYVTPACIAHIDDPAAKYYTIMRLAVPSDVAFLITASPATQLKLARTADEHRESLIRDIHDGTLRPDLDVPAAVRQALRPRLKADPAAARRLEELVRRRGRLLPRDYWNLGFLANWTGGTMGLYLRDFPEYFGDVPVRDIGLLASEGRVSIPVEDGTPAGILDVTSHFIEFVPRDEMETSKPIALRSHQVEVGQEYFVLLTTSSGLYRYDLGDLVRVVGFAGETPIIEFLNKGAHTCSLAGEKLTEHQVILAMKTAVETTGVTVTNFILAPRWGSPPHYTLHIEPDAQARKVLSGTGEGSAERTPKASGEVAPATSRGLADLAHELDRHLQAVNIEYASRRASDRLGPLRLNLLPEGFLARWDLDQANARRPGNEQYKHRYLFTRPGEDESFPAS